MASATDFPARGKVIAVKDGVVTFVPTGTNYEIYLDVPRGTYDGPMGTTIECLIRATARKLWTVPSGGNFIAPIFGPPRIIQGRVRYVDEQMIVIQAGTPIIVELPKSDAALDLPNGMVTLGSLVNVTAMPGITFDALAPAVK